MKNILDVDSLGSRIKQYESIETEHYFMDNLPLYARIDGRAFHTFCRGLNKPFDSNFIEVMRFTGRTLLEETGADVVYIQSDEISLGWSDIKKAPFDKRKFKLISVLSSIATSAFIRGYKQIYNIDLIKTVSFDCRVFQVPSLIELANCFVWRCNDAVKNSVSMVAQANFAHKELQSKKSYEMIDMLLQKGISYYNDFDMNIRQGIFYNRVNKEIEISEELKKYNKNKNTCIRSFTEEMVLEKPLNKVENKVEFLFIKEKPIYIE